jgi:5-formyltetrahydrofolate cyclo-ligase
MDHKIFKKVIHYIKTHNITQYIALYWPIENEVDTIAIADELLIQKYKICIPYIKKKALLFKPIQSIHFKHEYWKNMKQPVTKDVIDGENIQLMIMPAIGFNDSHKRLGYGFHHYNKYLSKYSNIFTIGLAYQFQRNNQFTTTSFDKMLNKVITD